MSVRQVASSTLWQIASQLAMAALSIITIKFVTIGLSKELVGNYNSAYGYLQLFGILADFGLYAVAVREVSRAKNPDKVLGALIVLRSIILIFSLSVALIFAWILPAWDHTPLPLGITIAALVPFFTLLAGIIRTIFQVTYKMQYVFIAEVVQRIITVSLIGVFIFLGVRNSSDLHTYHLFLFVGGIGAFVLFFLSLIYGNTLMRIRPSIDLQEIKRLFWLAAPYGLAYLFMALYRQLDITLIALLRPDFETQNAYYGTAIRMSEMAFLIPTFLLNSVLPIMSKADSEKRDTSVILGKTLLTILLLGTTAFLFSVFWSRPLVLLLTSDKYLSTMDHAGMDTALFLLALPMLLNSIVLFSFYVLLTRHKWQRLVMTLGIGAACSIILNIVLIPRFGFEGAAWTSIIVHLLLAITLFPQSLKILPVKISLGELFQWLAFSCLLTAGLIVFLPLMTNTTAIVIGFVMITAWMGVSGLLVGLDKTLLSKN